MYRLPFLVVQTFLAVLLLIANVGCESKPEQPINETAKRLRILSQMMLRHAAAHKGDMPKDEKALREFVKTIPEQERSGMDLKNIDDLFISPGDNKPFIIKYGLKPNFSVMSGGANSGSYGKVGPGKGGSPTTSAARPDMPLMATESSGARRYVLFVTGEIRQMDEGEILPLLK